MNLEQKILEILNEGKPLKGREIALLISSKYGIAADKSEINSILYRVLYGKVEQDKNYQWTIKQRQPQKAKLENTRNNNQTTLSRLAKYYLECLSKDMDNGISIFARSAFNLDYSPVSAFPSSENNDIKIASHLINKVRNDRNNLVLKLGYPILNRSFRSKQANEIYMAEPLFIFTLDTEFSLQNDIVRLTDEDPVLNPKALESLTGINSNSELLTEIVNLYEELGINNDPADKPSLEDLFLRIQHLKPEWAWKEEINILSLSEKRLASINDNGIFNLAAVFVGEKSKYTLGLEKDLKDLALVSEDEYNKSALGAWISNSVGSTSLGKEILIEPIPINEEQREAILKGLTSSLTVVTGPPGTGKSQVVTNLIANAIYQGQTVLFTSKNNKAVDVVNERVNALSNRQVMLRLGAKFQTTLSEYLSGLLAARPTKDEQHRFTDAKNIHEQLRLNILDIKEKQELVIQKRNIVDKLEAKLEELRTKIGEIQFAAFKGFTNETFYEIAEQIKLAKLSIVGASQAKQSFFVRTFWRLFKKERFKKAEEQIQKFKQSFSKLAVTSPSGPIENSTVKAYDNYLSNLAIRNDEAKQISEYFSALTDLAKTHDLFRLCVQEKEITDQVVSNSRDLWNYWLQLLPNRMSQEDRKIIGDYISVLNLIVASENTSQTIDRGVWIKYYSFLPKITHILSCWAVTSLSARGRIPLVAGFFDLVIIDEASQCDIASAIPLLFRAKRAVIIGDDKQLTHISSISEIQDVRLIEKHGLEDNFMAWSYAGNSLFRLATSRSKSENVIVLRDHHRSHSDIIGYSNKVFYESTLRVATKYENLKSIPNEPAVRWIDIKGTCLRPESGSTFNDKEADAIVNELKRLISTGYKGTIGVVTPFRAQSQRIQDKISQNQDLLERLMLRDFLCDTVHKFQGDEKDLMIFSPVVSDKITTGSISFLNRTGNLFNVAITRARAILIIIGDNRMCLNSGIKHYKGFVEYVNNLNLNKSEVTKQEIVDYGPRFPKLGTKTYISDWEKHFYEALHKAGISTMPQYQVDQYTLDLALFKGERKLNIEVDGEKYHRNWDGELLRRDQIRNKRLIELGWDVQRFWVYEIRDNMGQCIQKIKEWME